MKYQHVENQRELDQALGQGNYPICMGSSCFEVYGNATVEAYGNATVEACGNATVKASENATVRAYGNATVEAYGNATVRAYGNATVRAYGSATVRASENATVRASENATVKAYGSATVKASENATVKAYGSATVKAYGSATVEAYGNATVRASENATVRASAYVVIHKMPNHTKKISGGVVFKVPRVDDNPKTFVDYYGLQKTRAGYIVVFKAVHADTNRSDYGALYEIGQKTTCPDWDKSPRCGGGLHFCPTPWLTKRYSSAQRYLACKVKLSDVVVISQDKIKAPSCEVLYEVNVDGDRI